MDESAQGKFNFPTKSGRLIGGNTNRSVLTLFDNDEAF